MSDLPEVVCPECDARFAVIWNRSWETDGGPLYCPFCGEEFEYESNVYD
jgi:uncharacterized Zn-finger protein